MSAELVTLTPKWYGESKVRMQIIAGDLRSLKDGRSRRVLPERSKVRGSPGISVRQ